MAGLVIDNCKGMSDASQGLIKSFLVLFISSDRESDSLAQRLWKKRDEFPHNFSARPLIRLPSPHIALFVENKTLSQHFALGKASNHKIANNLTLSTKQSQLAALLFIKCFTRPI